MEGYLEKKGKMVSKPRLFFNIIGSQYRSEKPTDEKYSGNFQYAANAGMKREKVMDLKKASTKFPHNTSTCVFESQFVDFK